MTEVVGPPHRYLSTGCLHGEHDYCSSMTGLAGAKRPARCKFCDAACVCLCHGLAGCGHDQVVFWSGASWVHPMDMGVCDRPPAGSP